MINLVTSLPQVSIVGIHVENIYQCMSDQALVYKILDFAENRLIFMSSYFVVMHGLVDFFD